MTKSIIKYSIINEVLSIRYISFNSLLSTMTLFNKIKVMYVIIDGTTECYYLPGENTKLYKLTIIWWWFFKSLYVFKNIIGFFSKTLRIQYIVSWKFCNAKITLSKRCSVNALPCRECTVRFFKHLANAFFNIVR